MWLNFPTFKKTVGNTMKMVFTVSPPFIHWDTFSKKSQSGFQEAKTTMNGETKPIRSPATLPGRIGKGQVISCIITRAELHGQAWHEIRPGLFKALCSPGRYWLSSRLGSISLLFLFLREDSFESQITRLKKLKPSVFCLLLQQEAYSLTYQRFGDMLPCCHE